MRATSECGTGGRSGTGLSRRDFVRLAAAGSAVSAAALTELNAGLYARLAALGQSHPEDEAPDGVYWDEIRKLYLFESGLIMMNNGTVGPMPRPVFNTLTRAFRVQAANPFDVYNFQPAVRETVRAKLAAFIGAAPDEVALTSNTTEGINLVLGGLDLQAGDEIILSDLEHPGNLHPCRLKEKRCGAKIVRVTLPEAPRSVDEVVDVFARALTPRTRLISVAHTVFITGLITPLREISRLARERGVLVLGDSAHGLGMLDLNMKDMGIDFFASSPYKWLGAPTGVGLLFVRQDVQEKLWPTIVSSGWDTVQGAQRLEPQGQRSDALLYALDEALDFQNRIGKARIVRRIASLGAYLRSELGKIPGVKVRTPADPYLGAGLTQFGMSAADPNHLVNYVREKYNLVVRTTGSADAGTYGVRVSTPLYVTYRDIDKIVESVRRLQGSRS